MNFVETEAQVRRNLAYLDSIRLSGSSGDRSKYQDLIAKGTCFLVYLSGMRPAFAPSRFIGYDNNTFASHAQNPLRDGRLTTPTLSEIFGAEPAADDALETAYHAFCASLGISPRPTGTAGAPRRYWILEDAASLFEGADGKSSAPDPVLRFELGRAYTRDAVADILQLSEMKRRGNWLTGCSRQGSEFFLFANVGVAGRTGHDYANRWDGKELIWYARGNALPGQPEVTDLLSGDFAVHVFWRGQDRGSFTYVGEAAAVAASQTQPIQVLWSFDSPSRADDPPGGGSTLATRRGPPPSPGSHLSVRSDGTTDVYLMRLEGPVSVVYPKLGPGEHVIKVGMSNDPSRRVVELSCGFPPGCALQWKLVARRAFKSGKDAYAAEGALLNQLLLDGCWIGGEFAVVDDRQLQELAALGASTKPR